MLSLRFRTTERLIYQFLLGGYNFERALTASVELLDIETLTWSKGPALPVASYGTTLVPDNGQLYLVGGEFAEIYSFSLDGWTLENESLANGQRLFSVAFGVNDADLFDCN